MSLHLCGFFYR